MSDLDGIDVQPRPCWIAGRAEQGESIITVRHPYDGTEVADVAVPSTAQQDKALSCAQGVTRSFAVTPSETRVDVLRRAGDLITARAEEIAETITAETAKPLTDALVAVARSAAAFHAATATAQDSAGDLRREHDTYAVVRQRSRGPVLAITPHTSPLLIGASQAAAAIAVGSPIVIVPSVRTPMTALLLGEILADTGLPSGAFSVLPVPDVTGLIADPRLPVVTATGTRSAGRAIADLVPHKHVVLSVCGDVTAIVCSDWANLDDAATRIAAAMPRRVIVHSDVADRFVPLFVAAVAALRTGDPHDPDVAVGSLIDAAAAEQTLDWLAAAGGEILTGGTADGASLRPTVLTDVAASLDDVAGPVTALSVVDDMKDTFAALSSQLVGVFTHDAATGFAAMAVDADQVLIGDIPVDVGVEAVVHDITRPQHTVFKTGLPPART